MFNRQQAEAKVFKWIDLIDPSGTNTKEYKTMFAKMSDDQFKVYMIKLRDKRDYVSIIIPNHKKSAVTVENNLKVAKMVGHNFFQRIWQVDPFTNLRYLSNPSYLVVYLPTRRQIQTLQNKISIPEDNTHVDELTDQPTGPSKGAAISQPEMLVLHSYGLDKGIDELMNIRAGNLTAMNAMDKQIRDVGGVSLARLKQMGTRVKSTQTLSDLLSAAHIRNNY